MTIDDFQNVQDYLASNKFQVVIKRLPSVSLNCTSVKLPDITINPAQASFKGLNVPLPGNKINYSSLDLTFFIKSDLSNYSAVKDWMCGIVPERNPEQYTEQLAGDGVLSDIDIIIYSNINVPSLRLHFENCFPINLTSPILTTTETQTQLESIVSLALTSFTIISNV